jgi:Zn-dependent protease
MAIEAIVKLIALVFAIVLHEVAHGYVAYRLGDPTAKDAGRLTLNPIPHIDPMGSIVLPLILAFTNSSVLLGWAKPVPFNPIYFRDARKGGMYVAAAGPATNLALAVVAAVLLRLLLLAGFTSFDGLSGLFVFFLLQFCIINVVLAVFNLMPIPPLDGSRIVAGFLPAETARSYLSQGRFGFIVIFGLLWLGVLDYVMWPLAQLLLSVLLPG